MAFRLRGNARNWFNNLIGETFGGENIVEPPPSREQPPLELYSSIQPVLVVNRDEFTSQQERETEVINPGPFLPNDPRLGPQDDASRRMFRPMLVYVMNPSGGVGPAPWYNSGTIRRLDSTRTLTLSQGQSRTLYFGVPHAVGEEKWQLLSDCVLTIESNATEANAHYQILQIVHRLNTSATMSSVYFIVPGSNSQGENLLIPNGEAYNSMYGVPTYYDMGVKGGLYGQMQFPNAPLPVVGGHGEATPDYPYSEIGIFLRNDSSQHTMTLTVRLEGNVQAWKTGPSSGYPFGSLWEGWSSAQWGAGTP